MTSPLSEKDKSLDTFIKYAQWNSILCSGPVSAYNSKTVKIGRFIMDCHAHDTGNSITVSILNDKDELYQVISGTYWFSSRYCFNKFSWENGTWDKSLDEAIRVLQDAVNEHKKQKEIESQLELKRQEEERLAEKQKVEKLFI